MPKPPPKKFLPHGIALLHEDCDLLAIAKPDGLLSVPARYDPEKNALALMTNFLRKGQAKSRKELFAVNRLDRETSGVLLFAKSLAARERMHENWSEETEKIYIAVLAGALENDSGTLESFLVQDDDYRVHSVRDASAPGAKLARTDFEVVRRGNGFTTVLARIFTGRKNQIRVQFADAGHALLGDKMYGRAPAKRLALHAWRIAFSQPRTREKIELEAPIPEFFSRYLPPEFFPKNLPRERSR